VRMRPAGLINNAGLQTPPDATTEDGFEVR
jgi:hypothetical protein